MSQYMVFPSWACSQLLIVFHLGTKYTQANSRPWASRGLFGTSALSSRAPRLSSFLWVNRAMKMSQEGEEPGCVLFLWLPVCVGLPGCSVTKGLGKVGMGSSVCGYSLVTGLHVTHRCHY